MGNILVTAQMAVPTFPKNSSLQSMEEVLNQAYGATTRTKHKTAAATLEEAADTLNRTTMATVCISQPQVAVPSS